MPYRLRNRKTAWRTIIRLLLLLRKRRYQLPARPTLALVSGFCSLARTFAPRFLQTTGGGKSSVAALIAT